MVDSKENEEDTDEVETGIESDEGDDTRHKAEEIGKKLGVSKEKEEIPDFEIEEEDEGRLGRNEQRRAETERHKEHKQLSNREKRQLRKRRNNERFQEKDRTIQELRNENRALAERMGQIENSMQTIDWDKINKDYKDNHDKFKAAERMHQEAFREGDGTKATEAMREMYAAQRAIEKIEDFAESRKRVQSTRVQSKVDTVAKELGEQWAQRNPWFHGAGAGDEDSEIAFAISATMVKQGYDPKSQAYWNELDKRIAKRLPHISEDMESEDMDDVEGSEEGDVRQDHKRSSAPQKRQSPPVSGGSSRGDIQGKVKVRLPAAFINKLKENGMWEDKDVRDRKIKYFLDSQRQIRAQ